MNEEIEKILQDTGVTELMEQKIKEAEGTESPNPEATPVVQPANTEPPAATPEPPAAIVDPEKAETPIEEDIWKDVIKTEAPVEVDWKAEAENKANALTETLSKIEKNKLLKTLYDVHDAPDFDLEKFFEVHAPKKKVDYTQYPVESLYKQSLADDTIAGYTPDEIDGLWEKKKQEIEDDPTIEKTLKSQLVREFKSKSPVVSEEEPEIIKEWKQSKEAQVQLRQKATAEHADLITGIGEFAKSVLGKKVAGLEVTQEDIDAVLSKNNPATYRNKDGKLDATLVGKDRLKAQLFDKVVKYYQTKNKEEALIEARKSITRPNPNENGGGQVVSTDGKDEATKIIENVMVGMGLDPNAVIN